MKKNYNLCMVVVLVLSLFFGAVYVQAADSPSLTGTWVLSVNYILDGTAGDATTVFILLQESQKITGTFQGPLGESKVTGKIEGSDFELSVNPSGILDITYRGKVEGNKLSGISELGPSGSRGKAKFTGERKETGNNPAASIPPAVKAGEKTTFPTQSVPGLYVNKSPAFSVSYPANWVEKAPDMPGCVFRVESTEGFPVPSLRIFVIQTMGAPLEYAADIYLQEIAKIFSDVKLLYDKQTQREDGTPAREAEFEWTVSGLRLKGLYVTTRKGADWVFTAVIADSSQGEMDESLKKFARSLKFKPEGAVLDKEAKTSYRYKTPEQTDDGWQTADASEMKLNKKKLNDLAGKILKGTYPNIHSVLVIKNGKLVFEEYFPGRDRVKGYVAFTREDLHGVMSVTKSFTSTLIGIAIDKGLIKGIQESLLTFFPEYKKELSENNKGAITLQEVLSMTAGFDWDETMTEYSDPVNSFIHMFSANDMIGYLLSRPLKDPPGSKFVYNTGLSTLLGTMIERRSSLSINEFAQKYLLGPLGISKYELGYLDQARKVPGSGSSLFLRPRDMAKLGYMFLRKGNWKGEQIVSAKWVEEATREQVKAGPVWVTGYGYQWWMHKSVIDGKTIEGYAAIGYGGQGIFVFPGLDAVIVFTAGNYSQQNTVLIPWGMLNNDILPAMIKPE